MGKRWMPEEDIFLKEAYMNTEIKFIASTLNRTLKSVYHRANLLGLIIKPKTKWTTDSFQKYVLEITDGEYVVLNNYIKSNKKVLVKHTLCGHEYEVTPNKFLTGRRCPNCAIIKVNAQKRKTTEKFAKEISEIDDHNFELIGDYITNSTRVKILHKECGQVFEILPYNFLYSKKCPLCYKKQTTVKSHDTFIKEITKKYGNEYEILDTYINSHTHLLVRHMNCGFEWKISPTNLLRGYGCPICGMLKSIKSHTKTHEKFLEEVLIYGEGEYEVLGQYVNNRTPIKLKHLKCHHEWDVIPGNFLKGRRCPKCFSISRGESKIEDSLIFNNAFYDFQFKIDDCINPITNQKLIFDFAIFNDSEYKNIAFLIEYQGEGHYKAIDWAGRGIEWAEEKLREGQYRDKLKRQYCLNNNIILLEIPYWDFNNISNILDCQLHACNLL